MNHSVIGDALFTKTQQQVLGLLYGNPDRSYYLNEVVRLAGMGKGTVRRELEKLTSSGLLMVSRQGNQNHYQANKSCPIFAELKIIIQKTFGVVGVLQTALDNLLPELEQAFIYGSIAKGSEHNQSDIDLMLVGENLRYGEVMELLANAEQQLGRTINPTLYTPQDFRKRVEAKQSFITRVMEQPRLWLKKVD